MKKVIVLMLVPWSAWGMDGWSALSMVESGDNDYAVGRAGEISRYQVLKKEWQSVTNSRAYSQPQTAAAVARVLLGRRVQQFEQKAHRPPTSFEVYVLWNAPAQALKDSTPPARWLRGPSVSPICAIPNG
jgi:hypothetical protein